MTYCRKSMGFSRGIFLVAMVLVSALVTSSIWTSDAAAQPAPQPVRVVVLDVPEGGTERLLTELQSVEGLDVRDSDWFMGQVKGRGFRAETIMERAGDLRWVMSGSSIDFLLHVVLNEEETGYIAHFIEAQSGQPQKSVQVDKSESGLSGAGASFLRLETERLTGIVKAVGAEPRAEESVSLLEDEVEASDDPEVVRARAASEKQAIADRLKRDWLWLRGGFRLTGKDTLVASRPIDKDTFDPKGTYAYPSNMMAGMELDIEAYPFSLSNPEMASAGIYANYYHGFDSAQIPLEDGDILSLPIHHFGIEGGAIYRMDSPLGTASSLINQQVRFKLGVRYTASAVGENEYVPSLSMVSLVLGTRLSFPVGMSGLAVWANADLVPLAFVGNQQLLFGQSSHSYGFGTELGFLYEFMPKLGASVGYGFQMIRSGYQGEGELDGFVDALAFELVQGLRIALTYQY